MAAVAMCPCASRIPWWGHKMKLQQGTPEELDLALLPLSQVKQEIAALLQSSDEGKRCGCCDKPFSMTRKPRGVVRVTHWGESGLMGSLYLLCGKCDYEARHAGKIPGTLLKDARQGYEALRLMQAPAGGNA